MFRCSFPVLLVNCSKVAIHHKTASVWELVRIYVPIPRNIDTGLGARRAEEGQGSGSISIDSGICGGSELPMRQVSPLLEGTIKLLISILEKSQLISGGSWKTTVRGDIPELHRASAEM